MGDQSHELKLERAREQLGVIDIECRAWIDSEPCTSADEPDPEPPAQSLPDGYFARRLVVVKVAPTPPRLSILIGDCLFNLRSSLDHLAFALAIRNAPAMTEKQMWSTEFPIFGDVAKYSEQSGRKICCIAPAAQNAIAKLQPYHRGDAFHSHPLWQIHELNRIDKHRRLNVLGGFPIQDGEWVCTRVNVADTAYVIPRDIRLNYRLPEQNAVLMQWAGRPADPNAEIRMNLTAPLDVTIGEGKLAGELVVPTLQAMCDFVADAVIEPLSTFL